MSALAGDERVHVANIASRDVSPRRSWAAEAVGATSFLITACVYFLGAGRSFGYDASTTVGNFIATPSLLDPFRREQGLNNHPLFSFLDHIVYSLGGHSEVALRVLPIICGAASVGLVGWWCTRRLGVLAGLSAAVLLGANPMFATFSRDARGYSLLVLCIVLATLALEQLVIKPSKRASAVYVVALAIGMGTHMYAVLVVVIHVVIVADRRELSRAWLIRWVTASLLAFLAYVGLLAKIWAGRGGRVFHAHFPIDLAQGLLGSHLPGILAATALMLLAVAAAWPLRRTASAVLVLLTVMIGGLWLVVHPFYLYPRFFMWLVPLVAVIGASAVARWRPALLLVVAFLASTIGYEAASWTTDPIPARAAGQILRSAEARGLGACSLSFVGESLAAYVHTPREVDRASQLAGCAVAVEEAGRGPVAAARRLLPYHVTLPAEVPYEIYSKVPLRELGRS
jgi:uncharacterized membrane protein